MIPPLQTGATVRRRKKSSMSRRISATRGRAVGALAVLALAGQLLWSGSAASASSSAIPAEGGDMFTATSYGYRYGPSIILDDDGMHVFTCGTGTGSSSWDVIQYDHSSDGGATWDPEKVVLQPSPGTLDAFSTCDPSVVKAGGYYYLAYTSTTTPDGSTNSIYVARSASLTGPFEKWNGAGWGGAPKAIVTYTETDYDYGAGEPSLVVVDGVLSMYYTWWSHDGTRKPIEQTRLVTASATDPNWPASLSYQGVVLSKRVDQDTDSSDVKYVDAWGKYVAFNSIRRFSNRSYVQMWESVDGKTFTPATMDWQFAHPFAHNVGVSGTEQGHIDVSAQNYIGYAYGSSWGTWNTAIAPIALANDDKPAAPQIYSAQPGDGTVRLDFQKDPKATSYEVSYSTAAGTHSTVVSGVTGSIHTVSGLQNGTRYFLSVRGVGPAGTGPWSLEEVVTPRAYSKLTLAGASASSTLPGGAHPASAAIDGDVTTMYSSAGHSTNTATEWISVDAGSVKSIGRIEFTSRQPDLLAGPSLNDAVLETSIDGVTWTPVEDFRGSIRKIVSSSGVISTTIDLPAAIAARHVRLTVKSLGFDDFRNYYLQLAEFSLYSTPVVASGSSTVGGYAPHLFLDGDAATFASSALRSTAASTESFTLDLGETRPVSRVILTPRWSGWGFPSAFRLETSTNGTTWTAIPGQTYTAYANPGAAPQSFPLGAAVNARYVRVVGTTLGGEGSGYYALQLAGMAVDSAMPFVPTASSALSTQPVSRVADGLRQTFWSSAAHASANAVERLDLDLGTTRTVARLDLVPRSGYGFPEALRLLSSADGVTWTPVPGQAYYPYVDPAGAGGGADPTQTFFFTHALDARYLRVEATKLRADDHGNYYFQLADVAVR